MQGRRFIEDPTVAELRARFPGFAVGDFPDVLVEAAIATAMSISAISKEATLHCIAHLLTLDAEQTNALDGGSGEVANENVPGVKSVVYVTMAKNSRDVFFTRSAYGRAFLIIEKASPSNALAMFSA